MPGARPHRSDRFGLAASGAHLAYADQRARARDRAKALLRSRVLAQLGRLSSAQREDAAAKVCRAVAGYVADRRPPVIAAYAPLPSELSLEPWIAEALARGLPLAFPVTEGPTPQLREVRDLRDLVALRGRLREPATHLPLVAAASVDLFLVPGLLFDYSGRRLGRGGGYYDRLLAERRPEQAVLGVGFSLQIVPCLPEGAHDVRVSGWMTDETSLCFQ